MCIMNALKPRFFAFLLLLPFFLVACETEEEPIEPVEPVEEPVAPVDTGMVATATLEQLNDSRVSGTVTFTKVEGGVRVVAHLTGLPEGEHGFHVHEFGDCSNEGEAAGGHFAPEGSPHGGPEATPDTRHTGDLGNITADAQGMGHYDRVDPVLSLSGPNAIIGKAFIIHAERDDLTSQPSGDAGARVACGIIRAGQ